MTANFIQDVSLINMRPLYLPNVVIRLYLVFNKMIVPMTVKVSYFRKTLDLNTNVTSSIVKRKSSHLIPPPSNMVGEYSMSFCAQLSVLAHFAAVAVAVTVCAINIARKVMILCVVIRYGYSHSFIGHLCFR